MFKVFDKKNLMVSTLNFIYEGLFGLLNFMHEGPFGL